MKAKFSIALALFSGLAGGLASHYFVPRGAYAQAEVRAQALGTTQPQPLPEIRAQKFVLVDENGVARGVFGIESNGAPVIEVTDSKGRVYVANWDRPGHTIFLGGPNCPRHPTLLP